jgi:adenylate cyclase
VTGPAITSKDRTSAVVFADISGSTMLFEDLGDARAFDLVTRIINQLGTLSEQRGGQVVKKIGDEILCVFPSASAAVFFAMAAQMQSNRGEDGRDIRLRIGINFGPVVEDGFGDVFGDTVNVAARLRALASPGQIITTQETLDSIVATVATRRLGTHSLIGKRVEVEVVEILWEQDLANLTQVPLRNRAPFVDAVLRIQVSGKAVEVRASAPAQDVTLGRDPDNYITVPGEAVSRRHATIEVRGRKFYLRDHSTNGSYLRAGGNQPIHVRRESVPLIRSGEISLGVELEVAGPWVLHYEVAGDAL